MSVPEIPEVPEDLGADMGPEMESFQAESPPSPAPSYLSMESDEDQPVKADEEHVFTPVRVDLERAESQDTRQNEIERFSVQPREGAFFSEHGPDAAYEPISATDLLELESMVLETEENLSPMEIPFIFKLIQRTLQQLTEQELSLFKKYLSHNHSRYFENRMEDFDVLDVVDKMLERCGKVIAVKVALHVLKCMKRNDLADFLEAKSRRVMLQHDLKEHLKMKYETIFEGIPRHGQHCYLGNIYTDVLMTEGGHGEINEDHEVRQSEMASGGQSRPETALKPSDLFEPSFVRERPVRTVMTRGIAGIGLTVAVKKFIVDWIEGKANQDIDFVFPLPFWEQNLVRMKEQNLIDYFTIFYPEIKDMDFIESPDCKVLFIFDALDEYRHTLSFQTNGSWNDPKAPTSVDMLLTNLIRGNLFPSCRIWITTRTAASSIIPADCVDLLTQVHGFTDFQKEQYFRKKICDQNQARKILAHVKSSRSLYIMCHVPAFSWILVTVFARQIVVDDQGETPLIMTQLFTHYMLLQTNMMHAKYQGRHSNIPEWTEVDRDFLMKLGKLGFQLLEKGRKEFCLRDLKDCGLDVTGAIVQSGLCTELFSLHAESQQRVFRFVHLSIQEYLAAFYVYMSFRVKRRNVLDQALGLFKEPTLVDLLCSAVDKALQSQNGHLDLFLRFLLGLSVDSTQRLFRPFIKLPESSARSIEETVRYIRKKIRENASPERCRNLNHCLTELEG
ncbi:protein NLRC3 [Anguilla anguilla]|uniref:protein NLRC3 n=1 Tax=Anguilla anguilla TaxID=7936 RepID=UPI0015B32EDF|nr:protein NLRC3 [Anguilla anguilla]